MPRRAGALVADEGVDLAAAIEAKAAADLPPEFAEEVRVASASWLWERAVVQGCAAAQVALGESHRDGSAGALLDLDKAKVLFELAAQQGYADGAYALADLLLSFPERWGTTGEVGGRGGEGGVRVSGVTLKDGMPDTWTCGEYLPSPQMVNGRWVYRKQADSRFALWYDDIGMWRLGDVPDIGSTVGRCVPGVVCACRCVEAYVVGGRGCRRRIPRPPLLSPLRYATPCRGRVSLPCAARAGCAV